MYLNNSYPENLAIPVSLFLLVIFFVNKATALVVWAHVDPLLGVGSLFLSKCSSTISLWGVRTLMQWKFGIGYFVEFVCEISYRFVDNVCNPIQTNKIGNKETGLYRLCLWFNFLFIKICYFQVSFCHFCFLCACVLEVLFPRVILILAWSNATWASLPWEGNISLICLWLSK